MSTSSPAPRLREDIAAIQEKRRLLEQILDVSKAIAHMQDSLDSVLILGLASKDLPEGALGLYSALSVSLRNLPVNQIKEYLVNLEMIIKSQLETILQYAKIDFGSDEAVNILYRASDAAEQIPIQLLEEFKRTVQTTLSLRVLLRKRGVATPGSPLAVPAEVIQQQLEQLDVQEQHQRDKIQHEIVETRDNINRILDNPDYPENMKLRLRDVGVKLDKDLLSLEKGASLNALSFVTNTNKLTRLEELTEAALNPSDQPVTSNKLSFTQAASRWLNSPWNVTWSQIKKEN
jgi:hypothetical protein